VKALLVRVGADQSEGGGWWNAPVDSQTCAFAYVPIPESKAIRPGLEKPYHLVSTTVQRFGRSIPTNLVNAKMHLDPDFSFLTYGDQGERAKQIRSKLGNGDLLVFYAALADINSGSWLIYAIIGAYVIDAITLAVSVPQSQWDANAHTRRILPPNANDIVIRARPKTSGRLQTCLPIGEFRDRAYRVTNPLLKKWGGLSVRDGYLQRSARLPEILNAGAFYTWFQEQRPLLIARNN
jgi:Nucleotide modification associated domain 3